MLLGSLLATFALTLPTHPVQKDEKPLSTAEEIDKFVGLSRTGSAIIRPQAARKLLSYGEPAADRLLELSGDSNRDLAALGTSLVEVLGEFDDPRLRARLWPAIEDSEFPWRPAAARSLALHARANEWDRFAQFLDDPIAPVRLACLDALAAIEEGDDARRNELLQHAATQLADENDIVRRSAALHLDRLGHGRALLWLAEDLRRTDTFFGVATGEAARYAALYAFEDAEVEVGDYNAADPESETSLKALASLDERLLVRAESKEKALPESERLLVPRELPSIALAKPPVKNVVLGLQLRSCRRGDYFLRWTADDELIIGYGSPARIELPEGTTAQLVDIAGRAQNATKGTVYWGRPGCDMELYAMPRVGDRDGSVQQLIISKDEQPVSNLRPRPLTSLGAALAASIPTGKAIPDDPRTRELAERVFAAFASIGGAVSDGKAAGKR